MLPSFFYRTMMRSSVKCPVSLLRLLLTSVCLFLCVVAVFLLSQQPSLVARGCPQADGMGWAGPPLACFLFLISCPTSSSFRPAPLQPRNVVRVIPRLDGSVYAGGVVDWSFRSPSAPLSVNGGRTAAPGEISGNEAHYQGPVVPSDAFYILDGTALLYRAFYSRTELEGYDWERPLILMGMEIGQFLKTVEPRYVAVSFDYIGDRRQNVRHAIYPQYKANRPPRPPELTALLPLARKLVKALGLRALEADGYEADDVMATMATWASRRGLATVLVTEDKDLFQSVNDTVYMMHPRTGELWGPQEVHRKCGVRPDQSRDLQSLVGDPIDNIPGVQGVGKKTGVCLLRHFDSLDGIYGNLDHVGSIQVYGAKKLKARLLAQKSEAYMFRRVTTLVNDVPLEGMRGLTVPDFRFRGVDWEGEEIMEALGFKGPLHFVRNNVWFDYW